MKPPIRIAALAAVSLCLFVSGCRQPSAADADQAAAPSARAEAPSAQAEAPSIQATTDVEAGRYLALVGGCNDCHTPGWMEQGPNVPESEWLTGLPIGFRGPWGTSYPKNLRLTVQTLDEDQWVARLHGTGLPPMPWMNVNAMSEADARALYRYIDSLGPAGQPAPTPVAPGEEPATPYFDFVPQHMERLGPPPAASAEPEQE